jgi:hypothetical protein
LLASSSDEKPTFGEVVAVGEGRKGEDGEITKPNISVGATVMYSKYSGTEFDVSWVGVGWGEEGWGGVAGERGRETSEAGPLERNVQCWDLRLSQRRCVAGEGGHDAL